MREVTAAPAKGRRDSLIHFGLWLSLVERLVRDQEAVGSNPTSPINFCHEWCPLNPFSTCGRLTLTAKTPVLLK